MPRTTPAGPGYAVTESGVARGLTVDERGYLHVEPVGNTAFGALLVAGAHPRVQIDAVYGVLDTDHETFSASGGSATASGGLFQCATGTSIGAYGVIRSRRLARYRPGTGLRARFTAMYSTPAALGLQIAGLVTAEDALAVGYSGTTFGVLRRIAGAAAIHRLTVTVGTGGAETITVTLNGVAFEVAAGGVLSAEATAELIAESGVFTGWTAAASPQSVGATVTFIQNTPAVAGGAFTLASTGTAAGSFATIRAGAANDDATGFVAQSAFNVDVLDGSSSAANPSGILLDPTKLNVFEIVYPYLGSGTIHWRVMSPEGHFHTFHRTEYPNSATVPSQRNPTFRISWVAASLGSTTNLTCSGASGAIFNEGISESARDPFALTGKFTAATTEYVALALRVRGEFGSRTNLREMLPHTLNAAIETANRSVQVRIWLNPTLTGTVNWARVSTASAMDYATPSSLTPSGGRLVAAFGVGSGGGRELELHELDLRLEPGDVLAVSLEAASNTAVTSLGLNWQEI